MRSLSLVLVAAALNACTTAPPPPPTPEAQAKLESLIAGKVAGQPITCLPSYRADQMVVIDDNTLAFEDGRRVYVNRMQSGCDRLSSGFYTLVTRSTTPSLCRGDIAEVADISTGTTVGSCVLGDFVPYTRP